MIGEYASNEANCAYCSYNQAIDMAKGTADFLWLASAMEGQICAMLLLEYLHADVGVIKCSSNFWKCDM